MLQDTLATSTIRSSHSLSSHAAKRMQQRGIPADAVAAALEYGRRIHAKGLTFCVVGNNEVQKYAGQGLDLSRAHGVQVLVAADGAVVTVYRNHDLHAIKVTQRHSCHRNRGFHH